MTREELDIESKSNIVMHVGNPGKPTAFTAVTLAWEITKNPHAAASVLLLLAHGSCSGLLNGLRPAMADLLKAREGQPHGERDRHALRVLAMALGVIGVDDV